MTYLAPLLAMIGFCGSDGLTADLPGLNDGRSPTLDLGTLADDPVVGPGLTVDGPDPCPKAKGAVVSLPAGPRVHDPQDPYTLITYTMMSSPDAAATLCDYSCSLHTTDCWLAYDTTCQPARPLETPLPFPVVSGQPTQIVICMQATGASVIPLAESVEFYLDLEPTTAHNFVATGPR